MLEAEVWGIARADEGSVVFLRPLEPPQQEAAELELEKPPQDYAVPIFVGTLEAHSILVGCADVELPRPLTHDLILSILKLAGFVLRCVEITQIKDNTFFARLVLGSEADGMDIELDSRPSDALALAVRAKCPIRIAAAVVAETGIPVDSIIESDTDPALWRETLREELDKAVIVEDYERAAELRDKLAQLENDLPKI
jgi:bifunctional DNase/RNase